MASGVWTGSGAITYSFGLKTLEPPKPISESISFSFLSPKTQLNETSYTYSRKQSRRVRVIVVETKTEDHAIQVSEDLNPKNLNNSKAQIIVPRIKERLARKKTERYTYLVAAVMSSLGVSSAAIIAVYYRFSWQMQVNHYYYYF